MTRPKTQKQRILNAWRKLLKDFTKREWLSVFIWSGVGIIGAALIRLTLWDHAFEVFLGSKYIPAEKISDDPRLYLPYLITGAVVVLLGSALRVPAFLGRCLRSWWAGVTSGLCFLSSTATFLAFTFGFSSIQRRLIFAEATLVVSFSASFILYLKGRVHAEDTPTEDDLRVSPHARSLVGREWSESDDPIRTWEEDAIGRASLVDSLSVKLMISKSPVLALFGQLGSGKTSTLNLLREHLDDKAIVVSFSTWLPGSQETFTAYLLSDIANECQKHYIVPGLRKSAKRLAKALGKNVPLLRSYFESLPEATQRDDIASIHAALERLPKRVIVLLDELDRMEKEELITLLKVIRGVSHLPNLSFVCAGDFKTIVKTVKGDVNEENIAYFEKFFFDVIEIPQLDAAAIKKAGINRLVGTLNRLSWFESPTEEETFRRQIGEVWDERIAPFCRTLRAIGLLANAVGSSAAPLIREVHPVDLTLLELLRRFKPQIYNIVAKNSVVLTGGPGLLRGGAFYTDAEKENLGKSLLADIQRAAPGDEELLEVKAVLGELFPRFRELGNQSWASRGRYTRGDESESDQESSKRIQNPEIFPAYFRYELPEAIFSSVEMATFLRRMDDAAKKSNGEHVFRETLDSMEKGSPKRDDFLRKLAQAAKESLSLTTGKALVHAAVGASHKYTYDMMAAFGEAGHVLRIVLQVAQRLPVSERLKLLEDCILEATDDTMALNVLTKLTGKHDDFDLGVSLPQLYTAFTTRMRKRYGRDVDAANIDLSTSDPWAFNYWGHEHKTDGVSIDPEDKAIQRDFWLRRIGDSRARLAQAFRGFFLPASVSYTSDVAPFVENKIPLEDLKRLYEQLPDDGAVNDIDRHSLRTLRRLLDGDFKNGAGPGGLYKDDDEADAATTD
jgi:predicted KAP-like P-loop ATPase